MGKWFRYYNQNRMGIWITIIAVIFIIVIIQTLNNMVKKEAQTSNTQGVTNTQTNEVDYASQSNPVTGGDAVPDTYQQDYGTLIDHFFTYCKNHEPEKAYGLLTQDCKDILYPTLEIFKEQYYAPKFTKEKTYTFQSWATSSGVMIYFVKIYDNMLATGKGNSQKYIEEYVSVMKENDTYKLNVSGFIGKQKKETEASENNITITIKSSEIYMDYEIAYVTVKNDNPYDIVLDSRNDTDTIYLENTNGVAFEAMLFENQDSDFAIGANQEKQLKIKFSNPYQSGTRTARYVFSDIIVDNQKIGITVER